jgi:hypothetical protein
MQTNQLLSKYKNEVFVVRFNLMGKSCGKKELDKFYKEFKNISIIPNRIVFMFPEFASKCNVKKCNAGGNCRHQSKYKDVVICRDFPPQWVEDEFNHPYVEDSETFTPEKTLVLKEGKIERINGVSKRQVSVIENNYGVKIS